MKFKIFKIFAAVLLLISIVSIVPVYAACPASNTAEGQILEGVEQTGGDCTSTGVSKTIGLVVQILSIVAGIAAVIMVVYSGFKYITSGGDSGKVGSAKSSLIYALIGLAIAVLAQFLVNFVIDVSSDAQEAPKKSQFPAQSISVASLLSK